MSKTVGEQDLRVTLLYSEGCPHRQPAAEAITEALSRLGLPPTTLSLRRVDSLDEAEHLGFLGSPSIHIDGADPFADPGAPVAMSCRLYPREGGATGYPTAGEIMGAIRRHLDGAGRSARQTPGC